MRQTRENKKKKNNILSNNILIFDDKNFEEKNNDFILVYCNAHYTVATFSSYIKSSNVAAYTLHFFPFLLHVVRFSWRSVIPVTRRTTFWM